jgi:hypothetical protein
VVLLLTLASAVIVRSESHGTHDHIFCLRFETPPTWRTRSPYLYHPGTGWANYTPRHWVPFSSPPTTLRAEGIRTCLHAGRAVSSGIRLYIGSQRTAEATLFSAVPRLTVFCFRSPSKWMSLRHFCSSKIPELMDFSLIILCFTGPRSDVCFAHNAGCV